MIASPTRRAVFAGTMTVCVGLGMLRTGALAAGTSVEEPDDERPIGRMTHAANPLPPLSATFLDEKGQTVSLAQFRGRPVVLHLWATWCGPCRTELPQVEHALTDLKRDPAGPLIVPVAVQSGDAGKVRAFYAKTGLDSLPLYVDAPAALVNELTARDQLSETLPATFILNADGQIVAHHFGDMQWSAAGVRQAIATATGKAS